MPWERQVKLDATLSFATLGGAMQTKTLKVRLWARHCTEHRISHAALRSAQRGAARKRAPECAMRGGQGAGEDVSLQMEVALGSHAWQNQDSRKPKVLEMRDKAGTAYIHS